VAALPVPGGLGDAAARHETHTASDALSLAVLSFKTGWMTTRQSVSLAVHGEDQARQLLA